MMHNGYSSRFNSHPSRNLGLGGHHGFSLIETVVGLGIGVLMVAGSMTFIEGFSETRESIKEREQERLKEFAHKAWGRKFLKMTRSVGISAPYFKWQISNKAPACGLKNGGCFMKLRHSRSENLYKSLEIDDINDIIQKPEKVKSIGLFVDEGRAGDEFSSEPVKGCCKVNTLDSLRYKSNVRAARAEGSGGGARYFVGWTLMANGGPSDSEENKAPLFFMAQDNNAQKPGYFHIDNYMGTSPNVVEDDDAKKTLIHKNGLVLLPHERGILDDSKKIEKYKNRFYLFYLPDDPRFYFLSYVNDVTPCIEITNKKEINVVESCKKIYAAVAVNYTDPSSAVNTYEEALEVAPKTIARHRVMGEEEVIQFGVEYNIQGVGGGGIFSQEDYNPFMYYNEGENKKILDNLKLENLNSKENQPFFPGSKTEDNPFVPFRAPTIRSQDASFLSGLFAGSVENNLPLSYHYVARILSMNEREGPQFSVQSHISGLPIKFNKIDLRYDRKDANGNNKYALWFYELAHGEEAEGIGYRKQRIVRDLEEGSSVIIARQLGTRRLTTFIMRPGSSLADTSAQTANNN